MELYIITIIFLGLAFAGISIKIIMKKDGKFSGTCASNSPFLNNDGSHVEFVENYLMKMNVKNLQ